MQAISYEEYRLIVENAKIISPALLDKLEEDLQLKQTIDLGAREISRYERDDYEDPYDTSKIPSDVILLTGRLKIKSDSHNSLFWIELSEVENGYVALVAITLDQKSAQDMHQHFIFKDWEAFYFFIKQIDII